MFRIETASLREREAERFKTAFYRFLETNPPPQDEAAWLEAQVVEGQERQIALLWSQEAADSFRTYAANFQSLGATPRWAERFDGLGR